MGFNSGFKGLSKSCNSEYTICAAVRTDISELIRYYIWEYVCKPT